MSDTVHKVNKILRKLSLPIQIKVDDDVVTSLWIAIFESLFKFRLDKINRTLHGQSSLHNAKTLLTELSTVLNCDLNHIKPEDIVEGKDDAQYFLAEIFEDLVNLMLKDSDESEEVEIDYFQSNSSIATNLTKEDDVSSSTPEFDEVSYLNFNNDGSYSGENVQSFDMETPKPNTRKNSFEREISNFVNLKNDFLKKKKKKDLDSKKFKKKNSENLKTILTKINKPSTKENSFTTPPLLKVQPTDTPHMKALKLKRVKLLKENSYAEKKLNNLNVKFKEEMQETEHFLKFNKDEIKNFKFEEEDFGEEDESSDCKEEDKIKSIPEDNIELFQKNIKKVLPYVQIDKYITNKTLDEQIKYWKKRLDDRLWSRSVKIHKEDIESSLNLKKIELLKKEIDVSTRLTQQKNNKEIKRKALNSLKEKDRILKKNINRVNVVEKEKINLQKKLKLKKEKVLLDSHKAFLKNQRDIIIEEKKLQKEAQEASMHALNLELISKENYFKNEIQMLKEELNDSKKRESIEEREKFLAVRRLKRDKKGFNKNEIRRVKKKLENDFEVDNHFLEVDLDRIKQDLNFNVKKKI
ncbi:hypothetical protein HK099_008147 [Clydaea vesicula]|uniref:DUF5745 domain-containing protein n=1 Tax=Clydaea vesicula TaxID=447962 RepID=A0AAD5XVZ8_9FUNG|nr:hypothetical protein HK099_008147 [Clydaea vesicula]